MSLLNPLERYADAAKLALRAAIVVACVGTVVGAYFYGCHVTELKHELAESEAVIALQSRVAELNRQIARDSRTQQEAVAKAVDDYVKSHTPEVPRPAVVAGIGKLCKSQTDRGSGEAVRLADPARSSQDGSPADANNRPADVGTLDGLAADFPSCQENARRLALSLKVLESIYAANPQTDGQKEAP